MEYIDGRTLEQIVADGQLALPNAMIVLEQIASALQYAHHSHVFHRDLQPANVLLRFGDVRQVNIVDFGFARILDAADERLTLDGLTFGAPAYMAPEIVDGVAEVTSAVDIYAIGCAAYLMMSGRPPFLQKRRMDVMAAHANDAPPRLSTRCRDVPRSLDELLLRCLAKAPADRPDADELVSELRELRRR
jgi:serine/threonine-protein kinase